MLFGTCGVFVAQNLLGNAILLGPKGYLRAAVVHNSFFMG